MMFDDIIRFLMVFLFLLAPYAFVFYAVFGGQHVLHNDYEKHPELCEHALLHCTMSELQMSPDGGLDSYRARGQYIFNGSISGYDEERCAQATSVCRIVEPNGFETFYSLLFTIFRIALVDDSKKGPDRCTQVLLLCFLVPMDSFTAIDRYFAAFVCATYLLFTAILSINIFIGLISNALQTEAFSTVEARFLLERIEVILNYEWRFSKRRRAQIQEIIHRFCSPLQLNWKDINFDAYGQSREEQQSKALITVRQTMEKQHVQFDTFRIQLQQKLNEMDVTLGKLQPGAKHVLPDIVVQRSQFPTPMSSRRPSVHIHPEAVPVVIQPVEAAPVVVNQQNEVLTELTRLRELLEETMMGQIDRTNLPARGSIGSISSSSAPRRSITNIPIRNQLQVDAYHPPPIHHESQSQNYPTDLSERVTDLQLAVNRLHHDVSAIRQVIERMSPLSASLILGRTAGRK